MRLPFLDFLRSRFIKARDKFRASGHLRIERRKGGVLTDVLYDDKNFIVDLGLTTVKNMLLGVAGGGISASVFRMAIGDGGVPAGELFNPKQPDATWPARTGLFHEVLRQDIAAWSSPTSNSARFVGSFSSVDVDASSFSLAELVINEAALIIGDGTLTVGGDKKQINKTPPDTVDADEKLLAMRTFKSTPFDPAEDVTITVEWTLTVAK